MRRTRSRQARRSVVSGQTTPNRNGLVTDVDTSPPSIAEAARSSRARRRTTHRPVISKCETAGRREIHRLRAPGGSRGRVAGVAPRLAGRVLQSSARSPVTGGARSDRVPSPCRAVGASDRDLRHEHKWAEALLRACVTDGASFGAAPRRSAGAPTLTGPLTSSVRRRRGSSRDALSDGRSPCTSFACGEARRPRCAVASLAWLDHVWPPPGTGLEPVGFLSVDGGRGDRTPKGFRLACFRDRCRRQPSACPSKAERVGDDPTRPVGSPG